MSFTSDLFFMVLVFMGFLGERAREKLKRFTYSALEPVGGNIQRCAEDVRG